MLKRKKEKFNLRKQKAGHGAAKVLNRRNRAALRGAKTRGGIGRPVVYILLLTSY